MVGKIKKIGKMVTIKVYLRDKFSVSWWSQSRNIFFIYFEKISKASMVFTRQDMDGRNYKYDKLQWTEIGKTLIKGKASKEHILISHINCQYGQFDR